MKTQFKIGMKVDDGIHTGVVKGFTEVGYPVVQFDKGWPEGYLFAFDCSDIMYLKECQEEQHETV